MEGTNNFPHSPGTFRIRPGQRYIPELNWPRLDNPFSRRQAEPALGILRPLMRLHERALVHAENLIRQGVTANENVIARLGEIVNVYETESQRHAALMRTGGIRRGP